MKYQLRSVNLTLEASCTVLRVEPQANAVLRNHSQTGPQAFSEELRRELRYEYCDMAWHRGLRTGLPLVV